MVVNVESELPVGAALRLEGSEEAEGIKANGGTEICGGVFVMTPLTAETVNVMEAEARFALSIVVKPVLSDALKKVTSVVILLWGIGLESKTSKLTRTLPLLRPVAS